MQNEFILLFLEYQDADAQGNEGKDDGVNKGPGAHGVDG